MNTKGRIISMILCLAILFPLTGLAARHVTITELREQAKAGWQQTYQAHGRTISVDVMPHVPQVEAFPVLKVGMADLKPQPDPMGVFTPYTQDEPGFATLEANRKAVTDTKGYTSGGVLYSGFDLDKAYIPANPQTLGQMMDMVADILDRSQLPADLIYQDLIRSLMLGIYQDKRGNKEPEPGLAILEFYQAMRGIPVVADKWKAYLVNKRPVSFSYASPCPRPSALIKMPDQYVVFFIYMLKETAQLAPDVPLAGFDSIKSTVEQEIKAGRMRQVFGLTLGYAIYSEIIPKPVKGQSFHTLDSVYYAVPIWAVDCIYVENAKTRLQDYSDWDLSGGDPFNVLEYHRILINAQTGELVDPANQKLERELYTGFLSWAEVKR